MSADAAAWVAEHGAALRGLPAADAAEHVRAAGLTPRALAPDAVVTLEFRPDRVDLHHDLEGVVTTVRAG